MTNSNSRGEIATVVTFLTLGILAVATVLGIISTRQQTSLRSEAARSYCGITCNIRSPDCRLGTTCMTEEQAYADQGGGGSSTRYICWNTDSTDPKYCVRPESGGGNTRVTRYNCGGNCSTNANCYATDTKTGTPLQCDVRAQKCIPVAGGECPVQQTVSTPDPSYPVPTQSTQLPNPTTGPAPTDVPSTTRATYIFEIDNDSGGTCKVQFDIINNKIVEGTEQVQSMTLKDYASCYPRISKTGDLPTRIELPYSFDINNRSKSNLLTNLTISAFVCPSGSEECSDKLAESQKLIQLTSNQSATCTWESPTFGTSRPTCITTGTGELLPTSSVNPPTPRPTSIINPTNVVQRTQTQTFPTRIPTTAPTSVLFPTTSRTILTQLPIATLPPPLPGSTIQTKLVVSNNSTVQVTALRLNICQDGKCTTETHPITLVPGQSQSVLENLTLPSTTSNNAVISCSLILSDNTEQPCGVNKSTPVNESVKVDVSIDQAGLVQASAKTRTERADVDNNGVINATDYALCIINYYKRGSDLPCDLDDSGRIDALDNSVVTENFNRKLY